ncbi:hypothetical protein BX600DRAFT_504891 [Xylariales sp. PMI_506]|nr:hypothetical protein BX600DRAFT_504891 [Xylariales sp. PMI_506]
MGRKPNPLILTYFERGPKLNDNSNRYPHRCKACGEDFPKGRIDSLTNHLTKKCPAISEAERINACLTLHGISGNNARRSQNVAAGVNANINGAVSAAPPVTDAAALAQNNWTALETLAEVSRQIDLSEKHDDHLPGSQPAPRDATQAPLHHPLMALSSYPFELQEQFTLDNPPLNYDNRLARDHDGTQEQHDQAGGLDSQTQTQQNVTSEPDHEMTTEEKLRSLLEGDGHHPIDSNLSVAAAATARLNPSLLDPQLHMLQEDPKVDSISDELMRAVPTDVEIGATGEDSAAVSSTDIEARPNVVHVSPHSTDEMMVDYPAADRPSTPSSTTPVTAQDSASPWGEMTYIPENLQPPASVSDQSQQLAYTLNKGGFRMDAFSPNGTRRQHVRARFDANRRKEVQEVRRIGACIRCRILRKVCSKGTPCDTCRKVLSPRVWHTGCTRTKLAEQIELYSAGVQIVVAQKRVNKLKTEFNLVDNGLIIEASHFHETGHHLTLQVLQGSSIADAERQSETPLAPNQAVMIDNNKEDIPAEVENYMRQMLPEFVARESSSHVRATLECAQRVAHETNDELLRRSLELWGLTEIMDRERQWSFILKPRNREGEDKWLKDDLSNESSDNETFTTFCTQLTAGAERKAAATSKSLLNGIQRNLQDGKTKLGFPMFLTSMIFLNCVEKMTWAFKAWEGEALQPLWPLEKQPGNYYSQGYALCELLRMLLLIRHILPKVSAPDPDQPIVSEDNSETIKKYYEDLNVTPNFLRTRREHFSFDQSDSRSLELLFCSALLQP